MIPIIRIDDLAYENMFCMFCGAQIFYEDTEEDSSPPCSHVLFIATDDGYEHQSALVADKLPPVYYEDYDEDADSFIERLNKISDFPGDSFIIEINEGPPVPGTIWVGFSALGV